MAKLDLFEHPKLDRLQEALGCRKAQAIGHLELLWGFAQRYAEQGDVGQHPDSVIARRCDWPAEPACFVQALIEAGFLDPCDERRLVIHGWEEHLPQYVRRRLARSGKEPLEAVASQRLAIDEPPDSHRSVNGEPVGVPTKPSQTKPGQAQPSKARRSAPPALDGEAWLETEEGQEVLRWCRAKHPALEASLPETIDRCFDWARSNGKLKLSWAATVKNFVRPGGPQDGSKTDAPRGASRGGSRLRDAAARALARNDEGI